MSEAKSVVHLTSPRSEWRGEVTLLLGEMSYTITTNPNGVQAQQKWHRTSANNSLRLDEVLILTYSPSSDNVNKQNRTEGEKDVL